MSFRCPQCEGVIPVEEDGAPRELHCAACGASLQSATDVSLTIAADSASETLICDSADVASTPEITHDDVRTTTIGDYELLEEIARGGMGVVYKARQLALNRVVALKMIKSGQFADGDEVRRFHAEAEAAARLDHPQIVPIHEVGEQNGRHFFSMGLVDGEGLDAQLKREPLAPRAAAMLMKQVADAVQYAHEQGIVHRDLKPANVLIDADGSPRITDFGLARKIGVDSGLTATGQVLGTPGYMPPEQAAGKVDEIGPRVDVYALGAMLYAVLTGRPPFQAANVMETLKQVLEQEPVSPRALNPAIDRDLETIVLKCLEKDAGKRYESAEQFANELDRFLNGRPILARPVGVFGRGKRWCRRNPLGATVAGLLIFLAIGGPAMALRLDTALRGETEQRLKAERKESEARASERKMRIALAGRGRALLATEAAIDRYVQTVNDSQLLKEPRFKELLKELLKEALAHYEQFVEDNKDVRDAETRMRLANAFSRIGMISVEKGSMDEALKAFQQSVAILKKLVGENPVGVTYPPHLADSYGRIGDVYRVTGRYAEALTAHQRALAIRERLARQNPRVDSYQYDVAYSHHNIGNVFGTSQQPERALTAHRQALAVIGKLAQANPRESKYQHVVASSHNSIGNAFLDLGKPAEALAAYRQALEVHKKLARENPNSTKDQCDLASTFSNIGNLLMATGKPEDALIAHRQALLVLETLSRENPTITSYQSQLAGSHCSIGNVYSATGERREALRIYRQGLAIQEKLVRDNPQVTEYQSELAHNLTSIAALQRTSGKPSEALAAYRKALSILETLARNNPTIAVYHRDVMVTLNNIGNVYQDTGRIAEALSAHRRALAIPTKLVGEHPESREFRQDLAQTRMHIGNVYFISGKAAEALDAYEQALGIQQQLVRAHPTVTKYRQALARSHSMVGNLCHAGGKPGEALRNADRALALLKSALKQQSPGAGVGSVLQRVHVLRAMSLDDLSRHREAVGDWRKAATLFGGPMQRMFQYRLARSLAYAGQHAEATALAGRLSRGQVSATSLYKLSGVFCIAADQRRQQSDEYAARAIAMLRALARAGHFQLEEHQALLRSDPELNALRHRVDFRKLARSVGVELPAWAKRPESSRAKRR